MIESLKPTLKKGIAAMVGCGVLINCSSINGEPIPKRSCAAFTIEGEVYAPSRYPLGAAEVAFSEQPGVWDAAIDTTNADGSISQEGGRYILSFIDKLPDEFTDYALEGELGSQDVVIQITTPETGPFGVTSGCIESSEKNEYGAAVSKVSLPTDLSS